MHVDSQSKIASVMSNRIEELYIHLEKQLITNWDNPFKRRLVIVPNSYLKAYLQSRLADVEGKVAMGLEILLPRQALERIIDSFTVDLTTPFSSYLDLLIVVTQVIRKAPREIESLLSHWHASNKGKEASWVCLREIQLA